MVTETGKVTGVSIGPYKDSAENVRILQVQVSDVDDIQEIEHFTQSGEDSAPAIGDKVLVERVGGSYKIARTTKDLITPTVDPGEKSIYSHAAGVKLAEVKLGADGKLAAGNKSLPMISTPPAANGLEVLELIDRILTVLGGVTNLPGTASGASFLSTVITELGKIQTDLGNLKGTL